MFEKSLTDLVKGIRNTKGDPTGFITKAITDVKDELKSRDVTVKAQALQKMTYVRGGEGGRRGRRRQRRRSYLLSPPLSSSSPPPSPHPARPHPHPPPRSCTCWATT